MGFVKLDSGIVNSNDISHIQTDNIEQLYVIIKMRDGAEYIATNLNAIELIYELRPSAFEGKKLKYAKFVWIIHNLFGHPLMQIFAFFKCYKLAFLIHDKTVPKPIGKK